MEKWKKLFVILWQMQKFCGWELLLSFQEKSLLLFFQFYCQIYLH